VTPLVVPEVELAITVHLGPHSGEIDRAYGSLATYVADLALAVEGPIREYFRERVLGPDHPNTLTTRHELAYWTRKAGDPASDAG
jgi:effector-binding domain-containing protein